VSRAALVARIIADPGPVILIEAEAGTGKSWFLADLRGAGDGRLQIDVSAGDGVVLPDGPLILAKRPDTAVAGLARAEVYGRVSRYGGADLLFDAGELAAEPGLWARTGGWACLIPAARAGRPGSGAMAAFLRAELLAPLSSAALVALETWLTDGDRAVTGAALLALPFAARGQPMPAPLHAVRAPLARAIRALLVERATQRPEARAIALALIDAGRVPEGIALLQSIAAWDAALVALRNAGGLFFVHRFGPAAFDRMLAGFPPALLVEETTLVICRAIQAIKRGEVLVMRRILTDRWGDTVLDPATTIPARDCNVLEVRFIRLLTRTWEDFDLDARYLDQAYAMLPELPVDDDLRRGSFYNAVLEFYIRDRRFAEAEHAAVRAAAHYAQAAIPILSFYVDLHRAVIRLFMGHVRAARRHADAARAHLAATPFDSPGDARLLALLDACIAYEAGSAEQLERFLSRDIDAMAQGEVWPTIVELTLTYGSQALSEGWSSLAARSFLDRWRVTQARSSQFRQLIDIREVVVIQNAGRWAEAAARAAVLPGRVTLGFVLATGTGLATLGERDDVALALVWLRHLAQINPGLPAVEAGLRAMLDNPHLTARQRVGAEIWLAHVFRRTRRLPQATEQLRRTLAALAEAGAVAVLAEERLFLTDLLASSRLRDGLDRSDPVRRLLRQMAESGPGRNAGARAAGLTRQEARVLHAISEGATNKAAANLLGLSEATVKFHLLNLYRKLGCRSRADAVKAAGALALVS